MENIIIQTERGDRVNVAVESFSVDRSLALHRPLNYRRGDGWTITHVRSGLSVFVNINRKRDAEKAMLDITLALGPVVRRVIGKRPFEPTPSAIRFRDLLKPIAQQIPSMARLPEYWR